MFHKIKESFHRFVRYIKWLHMLYELNTYLSMCEPWEKVFLNCLIVASLCFIIYSTFIYIPGHIYSLIIYFTASPTIVDMPPLGMNEIGS
ncbi:hypothetical protein FF38_08390 [Lucilia cuprina]|uniref:Serine palmitoyltransferase small subunit B n=1 Tax=Lucilia cuprina TaxID=7375 RepID=A0A0L0BMB7_LUCCU|nr:serine palmitoyltransferase small subunit A [Lucilia cuprina]KNC21275.1 hypothetical protein FF38_08390 [Lucilia cuprina]